MENSTTITLTILNWKIYNPRTDVKRHSWFRLENNFTSGPTFFRFTSDEKVAFIHILCMCSQEQSDTVTIDFEYVEKSIGVKSAVFKQAIEKLKEKQIVHVADTHTSHTRNADVALRTNERTNELNKENSNLPDFRAMANRISVVIHKDAIQREKALGEEICNLVRKAGGFHEFGLIQKDSYQITSYADRLEAAWENERTKNEK